MYVCVWVGVGVGVGVCVCACVYLSVYVSMTQGFLSLKLSARNCHVTCILKILYEESIERRRA